MSDTTIIKDQIASVTADIDQAQAMIDEARSKFELSLTFQKELDLAQALLDEKRADLELMKKIFKTISE
jgi:hypothetical protein